MPSILMNSNATAWKGRIDWSYTQSISGNYSVVTASVGTWKTDGSPSSSLSGGYFSGTLYVGDQTAPISFQQQNVASEGNPQFQASLEVRIPHSSDGTGSVYIYCIINAPSGVSMASRPLSGGGTYSLTTIPRASDISASKNVYFGDSCQVTWTPLSKSFYYKLRFSMGSWEETTDVIHPNTTEPYLFAGYKIPLDASRQIPNTMSGKMTVSLYSYNNSDCTNQVGTTSTSSFIVTLSEDIVPVINTCSVLLDNSANETVSAWDIPLAGFTKINLKASASGVYGSTITNFNISGDYKAIVTAVSEEGSLDYTGSIISTSGNKRFNITCTDSRGRTSKIFQTDIISFLPYMPPRIRKLTMSKETVGDSEQMIATSIWEFDSIGGRNSATAKVYYKQSTSEDWTIHSGIMQNDIPFYLSDLKLSELSSYNFKVVVTDGIGKVSQKEAFSSTKTVLMDFQAGGNGLGIGKICEIDNDNLGTKSMEVSMDSYFWGNMNLMNAATLVISGAMYGTDSPENAIPYPVKGQIYFKKVGG